MRQLVLEHGRPDPTEAVCQRARYRPHRAVQPGVGRALLDRPRPEASAPVSVEDVEKAVSATRQTVKDWEQAGPAEHAKLLMAAADVMAAGPGRATRLP